MDSNRGPLVLEVTALPIEPQPLPHPIAFNAKGSAGSSNFYCNWRSLSFRRFLIYILFQFWQF